MSEAIKEENIIKEDIPNPSNENKDNKMNYDNKNLEIEKNSFYYNNENKSSLKENEKNDKSIKNPKYNPYQIPSNLPINNYYLKKYSSKDNPYNVFIRPDGKPDFGKFPYFNDYVEFDAEKYRRPEIYYGFVHDQYVVPHILLGKNSKKKETDDEKKDEKNEEKVMNIKSNMNKIKNNKNIKGKGKVNTIKSLDDIMNKYNLKYIEPPPKEKKVEPPPEEIPPEKEEENKDNKDKNKGKKESANKSKNIKDDKTKNAKPGKK